AAENRMPFSNVFAKLSPKFGTPINCAILMTVLSIILTFSKQFDLLTDLAMFVIWIFYVMTFVALFVLRKNRPELVRPYKVPLYPIIPLIAIIGGLYIVINTIFTQPSNAGLGLALTLIGLPVYFMRKK
ncbi:MAG: amino acid permease, partial [Solirubrobacterales bacterium]